MWIILKKRPVGIAMKSDCEKDVRKDAFANNFKLQSSFQSKIETMSEMNCSWNGILFLNFEKYDEIPVRTVP